MTDEEVLDRLARLEGFRAGATQDEVKMGQAKMASEELDTWLSALKDSFKEEEGRRVVNFLFTGETEDPKVVCLVGGSDKNFGNLAFMASAFNDSIPVLEKFRILEAELNGANERLRRAKDITKFGLTVAEWKFKSEFARHEHPDHNAAREASGELNRIAAQAAREASVAFVADTERDVTNVVEIVNGYLDRLSAFKHWVDELEEMRVVFRETVLAEAERVCRENQIEVKTKETT